MSYILLGVCVCVCVCVCLLCVLSMLTKGTTLHCNTFQIADVNECGLDKGGCDHKCVNTGGSYHCTCAEGYSLQRDNKTCVAGNVFVAR